MRERPEKQRLTAESLFMCEGKSCREIAGILGAGKVTVQRWGREGKWTERRRRRRLESPMAAIEILKHRRDSLIQSLADAPAVQGDPAQTKPVEEDELKKINAVQKLSQAIEKMESAQADDVDEVGVMLGVFERFAKYVASHADDHDCLTVRDWIKSHLDDERRKSLSN